MIKTIYLWQLVILAIQLPLAQAVRAEGHKNWSRNAQAVSQQEKDLALERWENGNRYAREHQFGIAASEYREGLKHWEHPVLFYNLVYVLDKGRRMSSRQDQVIVEMFDLLEKALEYGNEPYWNPRDYEKARDMHRELSKRLARITVGCSQTGVWIQLDGVKILDCPGTVSATVLPDKEFMVEAQGVDPATGRKYAPETARFALYREQRARLEFNLWLEIHLTTQRRYWARWKPWTVAAVGVVALSAGYLVYRDSQNAFAAFDANFPTPCPAGCLDSDPISPADQLSGMRMERRVSWAVGIVGGMVLASGIAGILYNYPRQHVLYDHKANHPVEYLPLVGPDYVGIVASKAFEGI